MMRQEVRKSMLFTASRLSLILAIESLHALFHIPVFVTVLGVTEGGFLLPELVPSRVGVSSVICFTAPRTKSLP